MNVTDQLSEISIPITCSGAQTLLDKVFFLEYICSMKVKTSITLSEDLLKAIDQYAREYNNRSEFIEEAVRVFIRRLIHRQQDDRDLEIINRRADYLNQEAMDVLTYQVDL
jgi:Arc/MetJ-type ribon-helix-helix transcriptional regulator